VAANYIAVGSYKTVQVLSGNVVQDIQYVTCETLPTGVGFAYPLNYQAYIDNGGGETLGNIATAIENLVTNNHVTAGTAEQDIDDNGLLVDYVDLVISYDQTALGLPALTGIAHVPITAFVGTELGIGGIVIPGIETPEQYCEQEYARLEGLAAG
jgi:hypothetical protein